MKKTNSTVTFTQEELENIVNNNERTRIAVHVNDNICAKIFPEDAKECAELFGESAADILQELFTSFSTDGGIDSGRKNLAAFYEEDDLVAAASFAISQLVNYRYRIKDSLGYKEILEKMN